MSQYSSASVSAGSAGRKLRRQLAVEAADLGLDRRARVVRDQAHDLARLHPSCADSAPRRADESQSRQDPARIRCHAATRRRPDRLTGRAVSATQRARRATDFTCRHRRGKASESLASATFDASSPAAIARQYPHLATGQFATRCRHRLGNLVTPQRLAAVAAEYSPI